jgi:hypothetical protein
MLSPILRAILPDRVRLLLGIARHGSTLPLTELSALRVSLDGRGGQGMHGQQLRKMDCPPYTIAISWKTPGSSVHSLVLRRLTPGMAGLCVGELISSVGAPNGQCISPVTSWNAE